MKGIIGILSLVLWVFCLSPRAQGDIYAYRDANGVLHFTNVPPDNRYRLFLKSYEKRSMDSPAQVDQVIREASMLYQLPYSLLRAVIRAESNFQPRAVSPKGAMGLMQLMPGTAKDLKVRDPFCPRENIMGGARYLRYLLDRFNGDLELALAAYNAGPERVEASRGIPRIPETVDFVNRVLRSYLVER